MSVAVRTGAACLHWTSSSLYMSGGGRQDEVFMWRHWHQHLHLAQPQPLHTATALDHTQNSTLHTSDWKYFSLTHWNCGKYLRYKNIFKIFPQSPCRQGRAGEGQGSVRTGAGSSVSPGTAAVILATNGDILCLCWGFVWLMVPGNWSKIKLSSFLA